MDYERVANLINKLTSDFLILDEQSIDVPAAGKLLNSLEEIIAEAKDPAMDDLVRVAKGINALLEKMVLESVDHGAGYAVCEKGIAAMQQMAENLTRNGSCGVPIDKLMGSLSLVMGVSDGESGLPEDKEEKKVVAPRDEQPAEEEGFKVQDESLLRDFIVEGLEYIGEIEINILNLEQNPEDKEYINAVFRPFHSIKGVASFLDLKEIRDIAHDLENLLDRARSSELNVDSKTH